MQIPASVWPILQQNKSFDGIRPTPNPKPNPDGTYTVKLTVFQWKKFQDNQKKAPVPAPKKPEEKKPDDKKPEEKPSEEINVTKEPSMLLMLHELSSSTDSFLRSIEPWSLTYPYN